MAYEGEKGQEKFPTLFSPPPTRPSLLLATGPPKFHDVSIEIPYLGSGRLITFWISLGLKTREKMSKSDSGEPELPEPLELELDEALDLPLELLLE